MKRSSWKKWRSQKTEGCYRLKVTESSHAFSEAVLYLCLKKIRPLKTPTFTLSKQRKDASLIIQSGIDILRKKYIEDITWPRGDTKFLFECWKIFHEWAQRTSEIFFQHEKRNFVSPSGHVMFYLLYKHQWTTKPFHFNSFLVWKARSIM